MKIDLKNKVLIILPIIVLALASCTPQKAG